MNPELERNMNKLAEKFSASKVKVSKLLTVNHYDKYDREIFKAGFTTAVDIIEAREKLLAECLADVVYGEPKDAATTYPYAEKLLKEMGYK